MGQEVHTGSHALAYVLALASLVVPVLAGLAAAVLMRWFLTRLRMKPAGRDAAHRLDAGAQAAGAPGRMYGVVFGLVLVMLPVALVFCPPLHLVRVGFWDRLLTGLLAGLGLFAGAHAAPARVERRNWLVLALATLVALGLFEAAAAWLLPRAPTFEEPWECDFVLEPWGEYALEEEACKMLYPKDFPDRFRGRVRGAQGAMRRVLHVGDSLVYMTEPGGKAFPELLGALEPGTAHINAGVPGVGPDYYYLLVHNWVQKIDVDLVVMHLFVGNDVEDVDNVRSCADYQSLLVYERVEPADNGNVPPPERVRRAASSPLGNGTGGGLRALPRFEHPVWGSLLGPPFMASPPPYALRVACGFSKAARNLQALYYKLAQILLNQDSDGKRWDHLNAVLAATKWELDQKGIPLVVVLMPHRPWLVNEKFRQMDNLRRTDIAETLGALGVPVLVPWGDFESAVKSEGIDRWFLDGVEDNHFSTAGHEWMATWLHDALRPYETLRN